MKKNGLIIQSLFVLPLITSSFVLSMETSSTSTDSQEKENYEYSKIRSRFETKAEPTKTEAKTQTSPKSEATTTDSSEKPSTIQVQNKWLGFGEGLAYRMSSPEQVVANVIKQLIEKKFDATHSRHLDILKEALTTTITKQDTQSTTTILTLCAEYSPIVPISDDIAPKIYTVFSTPFSTEVQNTNTTLKNQKLIEQYNAVAHKAKELETLISALQQTIFDDTRNNDIDHTYLQQQTKKIEDLATPLAILRKLNKNQGVEITKLFNTHHIEQPIKNTAFDSAMPQFSTKLKAIDSELKSLPALPRSKTTPVILAITK